MIVTKDSLAATIRTASSSTPALHAITPTTYDLGEPLELAEFILDHTHRAQAILERGNLPDSVGDRAEDNVWILKRYKGRQVRYGTIYDPHPLSDTVCPVLHRCLSQTYKPTSST